MHYTLVFAIPIHAIQFDLHRFIEELEHIFIVLIFSDSGQRDSATFSLYGYLHLLAGKPSWNGSPTLVSPTDELRRTNLFC